MAVKIGTLLKNLGAKAGLDLSAAKYADLLSVNADVPDEVADALESHLFNAEAARNNDALDKHFRAKALNGVDAKVKEIALDNGLSDEDVQELLAEKNSYQKIALLNEKVKAVLEKQYAGKNADKQALIEETKKLNNEIAGLKTESQKQIKAAQEMAENEILNYAVDSHFRSQKFANEEIPVEANAATARFLFDKYLKEKGARLVRKDGSLHLINTGNPDLDYLENNQPLKFADLSARVLADNKLLKVSDSNSPANKSKTQSPANQRQQVRQTVDTSRISAQIKADADALRVS